MIEEIRYSPECFQLTPNELVLLLTLRLGIKDFKEISAKSGIGVNKASRLLATLKTHGFIDYVPGKPETVKVTPHPEQDEVFRMPAWTLFSKRLKRNCSDKVVFSYLFTFLDENGESKKRRSEICAVLGLKKNTVNNSLNRLLRAGLIKKVGKLGNVMIYQIPTKAPGWFFG